MMRLKIFFKTIFLASLGFLFLANSAFAADCAPGVSPAVCPSGKLNCAPCTPPVLPDLEILAVELIGFVWVMTGVIFLGIFIYNAYLYMFNRIEDSKKRMVQWIIGLLMIFFSQPIVASIMQLLIAPGSQCYDALRQPTFTFFFPQVCTDVTNTPTPTP